MLESAFALVLRYLFLLTRLLALHSILSAMAPRTLLSPGRGLAIIGRSYLRTSDSDKLVLDSRLEWQLIEILVP